MSTKIKKYFHIGTLVRERREKKPQGSPVRDGLRQSRRMEEGRRTSIEPRIVIPSAAEESI
ncbi:MAG: hypothetical protein ISS76_20705 [Phycisphaerae bacterium]|nr:hypothetical protein [Phycisphaerae bacterium]